MVFNYTEFVSALMDFRKMIKKEQLLECFKSYDTDGSGKISFEEFCDMIKPQNEQEKTQINRKTVSDKTPETVFFMKGIVKIIFPDGRRL